MNGQKFIKNAQNVTRQVNFKRTKIGGKCQNPKKFKCDNLGDFQTMCTRCYVSLFRQNSIIDNDDELGMFVSYGGVSCFSSVVASIFSPCLAAFFAITPPLQPSYEQRQMVLKKEKRQQVRRIWYSDPLELRYDLAQKEHLEQRWFFHIFGHHILVVTKII